MSRHAHKSVATAMTLLSRGIGHVLAAALVLSPPVAGAQAADRRDQAALDSSTLAAAMERYHAALAAYLQAQASYAAASETYWTEIAAKRHARFAKRANHDALALDDYVLTQPPIYTGPSKPRDPSKPNEAPQRLAVYVPVVADFLAAAQREFKFVPRRPQSESDFKRFYAKVASAAGLTKEQIVRIYGFESGGNGDYEVQAGLEYNKQARAITTALGYNQLLATNSVEIVAESGNGLLKSLEARAAQLPADERRSLENKIAIVRRMVGFSRSVPDDWNQHQALAETSKGLGIHALNLDLDIGPLLQTQKLLDSVLFARRKGYSRTLSAAELEMMNLTGDGNGYDMIVMPPAWREKVPTANFFQRHGYNDNPVAQRNNVVAKLIAATDARMNQEVNKPGAKELAAALQ
jgi:hypothetical protein